jgi:glycosyltransferase involved in cell wall biosynthesis
VEGFLSSLEKLKNEGKDFLFRLVGTVSPVQKEKILDKIGTESTLFIPYVSHNEAISFMMSSSVLLLIIPDHHSNRSILTGKLFEYLASGKPVLCLGPVDGDAAAIIFESGIGKTFGYYDTQLIGKFLYQAANEESYSKNGNRIIYTRKNLTRLISEILMNRN